MDYRRASLVHNKQYQQYQQHTTINAPIYASLADVDGRRNSSGFPNELPNMWWDEEGIEATITRQFVLSQLRPDERGRLDAPLEFGDGLTDDTYWEWIESKAKRIFLILVDLGVPDQIFGVVDDSWDDDDLPIPLDQVERLQLTYNRDEKLERKFFLRQFSYLLRYIQKGENVHYNDEEVVPLELAEKRTVSAVAGLTPNYLDKVHLPGRPDDVFLRCRIPLGVGFGRIPLEEFLSGLDQMKATEHSHLTSLWASYIHQGCGYLLLTPVHDFTLKSLLTITPQSIKIIPKKERRVLLLNWIHCLADAVSFLHGQGQSHGNIKPSNVMLDLDNNIFLGGGGVLPGSTITGEKRGFDKETYDYSSPEQARPPIATPVPISSPASTRRNPGFGPFYSRSSAALSTSVPLKPDRSASISTSSTWSDPEVSPSEYKRTSGVKHDPQKSDIFSLATIFLEILSFLVKRASRNFASHRSAKNKTPGRGGGLPDSSFHKNLGQVESWMHTLSKDANKREDKIFRGVGHIITLSKEMLKSNPDERPTASAVQKRLHTILTQHCGLGVPHEGGISRIHCEARLPGFEQWDFGFDQLRLESQKMAAAACASVSPSATEMRTLALGNGGVIYGIEKKETTFTPHSPRNSRSPRNLLSLTSSRGSDGDRVSLMTKSSKSSGRSRSGSVSVSGSAKPKPKARAHQAPVYAVLNFG